jgi:hypothetical protein
VTVRRAPDSGHPRGPCGGQGGGGLAVRLAGALISLLRALRCLRDQARRPTTAPPTCRTSTPSSTSSLQSCARWCSRVRAAFISCRPRNSPLAPSPAMQAV